MDTLDQQVLQAALQWQADGFGFCLFTVVSTWGSSPRPPGAWLVIREDGLVQGSVSGGCIEDVLIARMRQGDFRSGPPQRLQFGVTSEEARLHGLPCGGRLDIIAEPMNPFVWLSDLKSRLDQGQLVERTVRLTDGQVSLEPLEAPMALSCTDSQLRTCHGPQWRLLIVGAGQITRFLVPMAQAMGFDVSICDPRSEYTGDWQNTSARLLTGMPDDEILAMKPDARCAIVALTHDPKLDDLALIDALRSNAFYVGALGSRSNQAKRKDRLMTHFGLTEADFSRLHGPVGLAIGSKTPPEIALSVMAEIIAKKNSLPQQT